MPLMVHTSKHCKHHYVLFGRRRGNEYDGVFTGPQYNIGGKNYTNVAQLLPLWTMTPCCGMQPLIQYWRIQCCTRNTQNRQQDYQRANGDILANSYDAINGSQLYI